MNQTNITAVKNFLNLQYAGKIDEAFDTYANEDFYWTVSTQDNPELTAAIPWAGHQFQGKEGYRALTEGLFGEYESIRFDVHNYYAAEDKVFAVGHFDFRHRTTGKLAQSDFIGMFHLSGGKLDGGQFYENTYAVAAGRQKT